MFQEIGNKDSILKDLYFVHAIILNANMISEDIFI